MSSARATLSAWQQAIPRLATFAFFVLIVACLYWARPVLIPIALALLITFMLVPAADALQRRRVPRVPAVLIVVCFATIVLSGALWLVGSQVVQLIAELPTYQDNVAKRVTEMRKNSSGSILANLQQFVHEVTAAATGNSASQQAAPQDDAITVRVAEQFAVSRAAALLHSIQPVAEPVLTAGLVIVLVVYLLIFRSDLRSRILALVGRGHLTLTTKALDDAGRRISRYLLAQFTLNACFGITIALGLFVLGVPHAALWGFAGGMLRYIPYLGAWVACSLPIGMSLLVSEGWTQPLSVVALFIVVEFFANLVIEPWLYGQSIGVSQAAWMVAIIFWTWLWGAVGLMLATPLTMCLVVLGKYVPGLHFIDVLLGDEPVLTPDVNVYQRLLARDEDEAAEMVRKHAADSSPVELCDQVLLPVIIHARQDFRAGRLTADDYHFVLAAIRTIAEHQDFAAAAGPEPADQPNARQPLPIVACPAQDEADSTALALFEQVLDPQKFRINLVSSKRLVSEVLEIVGERRPAAVLVVALPDGGLAHTRHLCKRVRGRFASQKIVLGRWNGPTTLENADEWQATGADYLATSLGQTIKHLEELGQFLRPTTAAADSSPRSSVAVNGRSDTATTGVKPPLGQFSAPASAPDPSNLPVVTPSSS
jgi:predicted PurR-regulated permease PerM